jgi:hypothetical protein
MKQQKKTQYRDMQILNAIREMGKCSILDILYYSINVYPNFPWDYHNIRNSITRLENNNKIKFDFIYDEVIYTFNKKEYKQSRNIKYISIRRDDIDA